MAPFVSRLDASDPIRPGRGARRQEVVRQGLDGTARSHRAIRGPMGLLGGPGGWRGAGGVGPGVRRPRDRREPRSLLPHSGSRARPGFGGRARGVGASTGAVHCRRHAAGPRGLYAGGDRERPPATLDARPLRDLRRLGSRSHDGGRGQPRGARSRADPLAPILAGPLRDPGDGRAFERRGRTLGARRLTRQLAQLPTPAARHAAVRRRLDRRRERRLGCAHGDGHVRHGRNRRVHRRGALDRRADAAGSDDDSGREWLCDRPHGRCYRSPFRARR